MNCYVCGLDDSCKVKELPLLIKHFVCDNCGEYYLEPGFASLVEAFLYRYGEQEKERFFGEIKRVLKVNKKVYFVADYMHPLYHGAPDDFIYVEFDDIFSKLGYNIDDLSRGSDYGD